MTYQRGEKKCPRLSSVFCSTFCSDVLILFLEDSRINIKTNQDLRAEADQEKKMSKMEQTQQLQQWISSPVYAGASSTRVYTFKFDETGVPVACRMYPNKLDLVSEERGDGDCHFKHLKKSAGKFLRLAPSICATALRKVESTIANMAGPCPCAPAPTHGSVAVLSSPYEEKFLEIYAWFSSRNHSLSGLQCPEIDDRLAPKYFTMRAENFVPNSMTVTDNLSEFVKLPVPIGCLLKCRVTRVRKGIGQSLYPLYTMELEQEERKNTLLMVARKRKKLRPDFIISCDPTSLRRNQNSIVGEMHGNLAGTEFTVTEEEIPSEKNSVRADTGSGTKIQSPEELVTIQYESDIYREVGPRKMRLLLPAMSSESKRIELNRHKSGHALAKCLSPLLHGVMELKNKVPNRDDHSGTFSLRFEGQDRVKQTSVKNFQIVHSQNENYVVMQFGRISEDEFILDLRFPLCPLQAFGIGLSAITRSVYTLGRQGVVKK